MKRTLSLLLSLCLIIGSLTGCAGSEVTVKSANNRRSDVAGLTAAAGSAARATDEAVEEKAAEEASVENTERFPALHIRLEDALNDEITEILMGLRETEAISPEIEEKSTEAEEKSAETEEEGAEAEEESAENAEESSAVQEGAEPYEPLQTSEGLEEAVYLVLQDALEQGAVYAQLCFAPAHCCGKEQTQRTAIEAALRGLTRSELKANLILCCEGSEEENEETVELCREYITEDGGVVALELSESDMLFEKVCELGLPFGVKTENVDLAAQAAEYGAGYVICRPEKSALPDVAEKTGLTLLLSGESPAEYLKRGIKVVWQGGEAEDLTLSMEKRLLCNAVDAAFTTEEVKAALREELALPYDAPVTEKEYSLTYTSPYIEGAGEKNKIILDTDMYFGNDDVATLFLTLFEERQGNCEIMAITTVGGNSTVAEGTCAALRTLELVGRTDIPVYMGLDKPFGGYRDMAEDGEKYGKSEWYGAYWDSAKGCFRDMDTLDRNYMKLDSEPREGYPVCARAAQGEAVSYIINTVHKYPGEVTLFIMGSGANVAEALNRDPTIAEDAAGVVYMGGALDVRGNCTSAAEFNWWYDPVGMQKCLEAGWKSSILIPNDIAEKVIYTREVYDAIAENKENSAPASIMASADYNRFYGEDSTPPYVWDALIALVYFHPEMITGLEERYVACETTPGYNYGRAVSWWSAENRDVETGEGMPENAVRTTILTALDEDAFWAYYVDGMSW